MKLQINKPKYPKKAGNSWKMNMPLNKKWVREEIKEIKKFLESNENSNTTYQNMVDTTKAVIGINLMQLVLIPRAKKDTR